MKKEKKKESLKYYNRENKIEKVYIFSTRLDVSSSSLTMWRSRDIGSLWSTVESLCAIIFKDLSSNRKTRDCLLLIGERNIYASN